MNFFKSVFSDDPEPSDSENTPTSSPKSLSQPPNPNPISNLSSITTALSFSSSLIKTLASKSEFVIETYRRDLEEFGSGLRKETAVIREAASRAVKELPNSLEAGAAAAQESLESVGQAIDNLGSTVNEIITHGKDSILADNSDNESSISSSLQNLDLNSKPYSRIDAQIRVIQCDMNTYIEEVDGLDEFNEWKSGFVLDEKSDEIVGLIKENEVIEEIYNEIVPSRVDAKTFWRRYFYRVYKVKKVEEARAKFVKRAISREEEEELSWDVDDDDYEENAGSKLKSDSKGEVEKKSEGEVEEKGLKRVIHDKGSVLESISDNVDHEESLEGGLDASEPTGEKLEVKSDEKMTLEGKADSGGSCKDSDFSVVSSQPSHEEEDLGWDEIEDIGSGDESKVAARGSPNRADLRKRLSAAEEEEEEDLTWDIEDDDDHPVMS